MRAPGACNKVRLTGCLYPGAAGRTIGGSGTSPVARAFSTASDDFPVLFSLSTRSRSTPQVVGCGVFSVDIFYTLALDGVGVVGVGGGDGGGGAAAAAANVVVVVVVVVVVDGGGGGGVRCGSCSCSL